MTRTILLRCPCPDAATAERIARAAVAERLAAAVNISGPVTSVYRWQGEVHSATEFVAVITTTQHRLEALCGRIRALHPYDTPALTWSARDADTETASWAAQETGET